MRRAHRRVQSPTADSSMTPMIDMVFLLLIYFILAAKPVDTLTQFDVLRPSGVQAPASPMLTLAVGVDGFRLNGMTLERAELIATLGKLANLSRDQMVRVVSTTEARHEQLIAALDACSAVGLDQIAVLSSVP